MSKRKSASSGKSSVQAKKIFVLPAECVIAGAGSLRESLVSLANVGDVTLDASAVQRLDTASLQLLTAFVRERRAADRAVNWSGVPALLAERAQLLGLADALAFAGVAREGAA